MAAKEAIIRRMSRNTRLQSRVSWYHRTVEDWMISKLRTAKTILLLQTSKIRHLYKA